mmetsp:Transcript_32488/g.48997  ORF Transcript_32488/g.48997 Transcript_32488/m.48997 type:complete len:163 (+) Transcript_32488:77-565(+)
MVKVGDQLPSVEVDLGFPPTKVNVAERVAGKKVIMIGLPAAFSPTCSNLQVPSFIAKQDELKAKGVEEVLVISVNDSCVMKAWCKDQGAEDSMVTFLADTQTELTKALDLVFDDPKIIGLFGAPRCKRFAMLLEDGKVKALNVAGGDVPDDATYADAMLQVL